MARIRKGVSYRRLERPYTRKSKFRSKSFVRAVPHSKIAKFEFGEKGKKFEYTLELRPKIALQIRHNALESARMTCNRYLEKNIGKIGYNMKLRVYPHQVLRENPLAAGAGADRMSTGMAHSFGKTIGLAARVMRNQAILEVSVNKPHLEIAKHSLQRAIYKIPCGCNITITKN
ncbi:MAG: 50S ribosomal protein L16 [Candidatus Woesearchaeota archaeon]